MDFLGDYQYVRSGKGAWWTRCWGAAPDEVLMDFAVRLANHSVLAGSTIHRYVLDVNAWSRSRGAARLWSGRLGRVASNIKRYLAPVRERRKRDALLPHHVAAFVGTAGIHLDYKRIATVAWFTGMRLCNVTKSRDSSRAIQLRDVTFGDDGSATIRLRLHKSAEAYGTARILVPRVPSAPLCPARALRSVVEQRVAGGCGRKALVFTRHARSVSNQLRRFGETCDAYLTGHSARIGMATSARLCGVPDEVIQAQGLWRSDAYRKYILPALNASVDLARYLGKALAKATGARAAAPAATTAVTATTTTRTLAATSATVRGRRSRAHVAPGRLAVTGARDAVGDMVLKMPARAWERHASAGKFYLGVVVSDVVDDSAAAVAWFAADGTPDLVSELHAVSTCEWVDVDTISKRARRRLATWSHPHAASADVRRFTAATRPGAGRG